MISSSFNNEPRRVITETRDGPKPPPLSTRLAKTMAMLRR